MLRTHTCGELGVEHVGQEVTLCGWVDSSRDHGGAVFLDVRDRYGKTQVVAGPEAGPTIVEEARRLRSEYVVRVTGEVAPRPEGTVNPKLSTGAIELRVRQLEIAQQLCDAAVHSVPAGDARRRPAAEVPLSRSAAAGDAADPAIAQPDHQGDARLLR